MMTWVRWKGITSSHDRYTHWHLDGEKDRTRCGLVIERKHERLEGEPTLEPHCGRCCKISDPQNRGNLPRGAPPR